MSEALTSISPGLMIWTAVVFVIFATLIGKFAWRPMIDALEAREKSIEESINSAEKANQEAQRILKENEEKMAKSQQEMMQLVRDGRAQAEAQVAAAAEEAEKVKQAKLDEAKAAIEQARLAAMQSLRTEVSALVVMATEKILKEKLDGNYQEKVINSLIDEISNN